MPDAHDVAWPGRVKAEAEAEPIPPDAPPSRVATRLARMALRWSKYPGRGLVGTYWRKRSRQRGGRHFSARTGDGVKLDGWYSPARHATPGRLPIVMMHGWVEVKEFHFHRARRLNRAGHDVILFDHRAHGRSTGDGATFGARERHDAATVIERARALDLLGDRYITMGFSMGAATALQHAADDPRVAGVIAMAPFVTFEQAIRSFREKLAPWLDERWLLGGFDRAAQEAGFTFDDTSTLEAVRRLEAPVLLVEAANDTNLPPATHTRKLAEAKTRGPLKILRVDHASHINLCRKPWPGLDTSITEFCASLA